MEHAPFRKIARMLLSDVTEFDGWGLVSVSSGNSVLHALPDGRLVVRQDLPATPIQPHPGVRDFRKAFWELRGRREWREDNGTVWVTPEEDGSFRLGLGRILGTDERLPVAFPHILIGPDDGA